MTTTYGSLRPPVMGTQHVISSGHYLAASAGYRLLEAGGNAVDAGVASGLVINVVLPENTNFGGVAPIMIYLARPRLLLTISGLGRWPAGIDVDYFRKECGGDLPDDIRRAVVPSAPDAWMCALQNHGTLTLEEVLTPALELARDGYPLSEVVRNEMLFDFDVRRPFPENAKIFMPNGRMPAVGELVIQTALSDTFQYMIDVERENASKGRAAAIAAVRDAFYRGDIAREMSRYSELEGGFLRFEDFRRFSVKEEPAVIGEFHDYRIAACGPWCQGPVVPQTLQTLAYDDLHELGHNSTEYIHLLAEVLNLSFSDRDYYYGDPEFVDVPMNALLSAEYTRMRRTQVDPGKAFSEMPPPGLLNSGERWPGPCGAAESGTRRFETDTSYTCVIDKWGNAFSATPSDSNTRAPIIPSLGFSLSSRGTQSWLHPGHASCLAPGKRPRLTPNPAIAFHRGELFMPFGCPGGDAQCQAMVQTFLNIVVFGMNVQKAIEQPRFASLNFPNSFWPHEYLPARLQLEARIDSGVVDGLQKLGHDVEMKHSWEPMDMGVMSAITINHKTGVRMGGGDPRRDAYAIGR